MKHNDMRAMLSRMKFSEEQPSFYLLNVGETHYPYALPSEPERTWPHLADVQGVFRNLDLFVEGGKLRRGARYCFDKQGLQELKNRQIEAVRYLDTVVEELFDLMPNPDISRN